MKRDFRIFKCGKDAEVFKGGTYYAGYVIGDEAYIVTFNEAVAAPEATKFKKWGGGNVFLRECDDAKVEMHDVTAVDGYEVLLDTGHQAMMEGADLLKYGQIIGALKEARQLSNEITKELNGLQFSIPGISRLLELRSQDQGQQSP